MQAIIRSLKTGEFFRAELDDDGEISQISIPLSPGLAGLDWDDIDGIADPRMVAAFEDCEMEPWDDDADRWPASDFVVEHRYEG